MIIFKTINKKLNSNNKKNEWRLTSDYTTIFTPCNFVSIIINNINLPTALGVYW